MSGVSFNGTTSKLEHTTTSGFDVVQLTILVWMLTNSLGENSGGRIFQASELDTAGISAGGFWFGANVTAGALSLAYKWSGGGGQGRWEGASAGVADGTWHAAAVKYDRSSTANDAAFRVDATNLSVTEPATPSGSATSPSTGYCIGNRTGQDRTADGAYMHLQFHPTLLSDANIDEALKYPGSVQTNGAFWWPMLNAAYTKVFTSNGTVWSAGTAPTATALADFTTSSPPCWPRRFVSNDSQGGAKHAHTRSGHLLAA